MSLHPQDIDPETGSHLDHIELVHSDGLDIGIERKDA